jgi:chromosome segregation ATPase
MTPTDKSPQPIWVDGNTIIRPGNGPWCPIGVPYVDHSAYLAVKQELDAARADWVKAVTDHTEMESDYWTEVGKNEHLKSQLAEVQEKLEHAKAQIKEQETLLHTMNALLEDKNMELIELKRGR